MNCMICGRETRVLDSRPRTYGLRRRRECVSCGARFTTVESAVVTVGRRAAAQYDRAILNTTGQTPENGE